MRYNESRALQTVRDEDLLHPPLENEISAMFAQSDASTEELLSEKLHSTVIKRTLTMTSGNAVGLFSWVALDDALQSAGFVKIYVAFKDAGNYAAVALIAEIPFSYLSGSNANNTWVRLPYLYKARAASTKDIELEIRYDSTSKNILVRVFASGSSAESSTNNIVAYLNHPTNRAEFLDAINFEYSAGSTGATLGADWDGVQMPPDRYATSNYLRYRAEKPLFGGGVISWNGTNLSGTKRLLALPIGNSLNQWIQFRGASSEPWTFAIGNYQIAYLRPPNTVYDNSQVSGVSYNPGSTEFVVQDYNLYEYQFNDIIIAIKNGDDGKIWLPWMGINLSSGRSTGSYYTIDELNDPAVTGTSGKATIQWGRVTGGQYPVTGAVTTRDILRLPSDRDIFIGATPEHAIQNLALLLNEDPAWSPLVTDLGDLLDITVNAGKLQTANSMIFGRLKITLSNSGSDVPDGHSIRITLPTALDSTLYEDGNYLGTIATLSSNPGHIPSQVTVYDHSAGIVQFGLVTGLGSAETQTYYVDIRYFPA